MREKNSYKHERSSFLGSGRPSLPRMDTDEDEEVGDAHSSDDRCDNRTHQERRGITVSEVFEARRTF